MPRVNIVLPEDLLAQMDRVAGEEGLNRSQLVRTAVLAYFDRRAADSERRRRQDDIQRAMAIQDDLRQVAACADPLKLLRRQRQKP